MRRRRLLTTAALALAGCLCRPAYPAVTDAPRLLAIGQKIDAYVEPLAGQGYLSGSLLVVMGGVIAYEKSFGLADYELKVPNTSSTRFNIASITKPLTVFIAAHFIESGELPLKATIDRWFPAFPSGNKITVEMLLRHRSGIPHRVTTPAQETVPHSAEDMVKFAERADLLFEPGARESYSSAGYSVLARILELVGGRPYEELLREIVLAPAGAVNTAHTDSMHILTGRASSYFVGPGGPIPAPLKDMSFLVGAGSVYSTPRDLLAIMRALRAGTFGQLVLANYPPDKKLEWSGISNGYRAFAVHDPEADVTVIFTGNVFAGAIDLVRRDVPKIAAGENVAAARVPLVTPVAMAMNLRLKYEGAYNLGNSIERLEFSGPGGRFARLGDWILIPVSEDVFFSPQDFAMVKVVLDSTGKVRGLRWGESDDSPVFARVDSDKATRTTRSRGPI